MLIKVVAREEKILEGEEITISYVNPEWPSELRRDALKRDYGFDCHCKPCLEDLKQTNSTDENKD
jgi:hypothetical protein